MSRFHPHHFALLFLLCLGGFLLSINPALAEEGVSLAAANQPVRMVFVGLDKPEVETMGRLLERFWSP